MTAERSAAANYDDFALTPGTRDIRWRMRLAEPPSRVYGFLATDAGRVRWWCDRSEERDGLVHLQFLGEQDLIVPVLRAQAPMHYSLRYLDGSELHFDLRATDNGGTDFDFTARGLTAERWRDHHASWLGALLRLKAICDHGVDLRNHDPDLRFDAGYVDA